MKKKVATLVLTTLLLLVIINFASDQPSASAYNVFIGRGSKKLNMELSPPTRLFHPDEDGYFYPSGPKITKYLKVINVGDVPFRICGFNATFDGDTYLATGLLIEIVELEGDEGPYLLYNGNLSNLEEGIEVYSERAVPPRKSILLQITVWMPETAGEEYQGLSTTAYIAVTVWFPPAYDGETD